MANLHFRGSLQRLWSMDKPLLCRRDDGRYILSREYEKTIAESDDDPILGVTIDLWGTLLLEDVSGESLLNSRISILEQVLKGKSVPSTHKDWSDILLRDREEFRVSEMEESPLTPGQRIGHILDVLSISPDKKLVDVILRKFNEAVFTVPFRINRDLACVVTEWRRGGLKTALLSNTGLIDGPTTRRLIAQKELDICFDNIFLSAEIDLCKPNPRIYTIVAEQLQIPCRHMLHIGDDPYFDGFAAHSAGYHSIIVRT